jgi:WhiB family redox-sensing transcriptional regulator
MGTEPWMARGNCVGVSPAVFFPSAAAGVDAARAFCEGCAVRQLCLEYALEHRIEHGVWGWASERERKRILQERRRRGSGTAPTASRP